ncbi:MAG TPA: chorismate mutase [Rickettsiales bacterium]|nr:chorismate mutase [Rickettsiales bacterium]
MANTDISQFRAEIDAIDDKIIALLNERSAIVKRVGIAKKNSQREGICYIRSGREAEVVRRIYTKLKSGIFPAEASIQMWRMIICASLSLESAMSVSTYVPQGEEAVYWLAREYFGNVLPVSGHDNTESVWQDLASGKAQVGVFPVRGRWWRELPHDIKIFACIPFLLPQNSSIQALAAARLEPENTGDDISLMSIKADASFNESKLQALFFSHDVKARLADTCEDGVCLVEAQGFIAADSAVISDIQHKTGFAVTLLGAYAAPITV